ncbi:GNAT family N-acetyltransferase [Sulfitobacter sp. D35]|uniref:GNAT family N-acetyltransferase n=1 Tax=Sulfitobacter sp. D35 TaxID=3083252 RepID=UPI00296EEA59|nr:GNAT family N-acetyltransferase [Sulfitobacter sp. D35]MDW4500135.1 GNAT family N-acetyltransferase [Sulfitobacter sp. D35]
MTALENGEYEVPPGKLAVIVTYLEMTARAPTRPASLPHGLAFRRVEAPDPDWYRDIYTRVGALDWLWISRLRMPEADLARLLANARVEVYTLTSDGLDLALLELDFRTPGACELAFFGVAAELIGSGVGRYLMNEAIARAWSRPISRFHVHTCTGDSPQALRFYIRSGFVPVRQSVDIADDPRATGELPDTAGPRAPIFTR